jgi:diguanylate cyclase (GGDEF)-like protein/PAS domain S-box-containing protein
MEPLPSVVIVEDRDPGGELVTALLREALPEGVEVRRHASLFAALADLRRAPAECVLLDLAHSDPDELAALAGLLDQSLDASMVVLSGREGGMQDLGALIGAIRAAVGRRLAMRRGRAMVREALGESAVTAVLETDLSGHCLYADERFCELTGRPSEAVRGSGWLELVDADDRAAMDEAQRAAIDADGAWSQEAGIAVEDGTTRALFAWVLLYDAGVPAAWLGTVAAVPEPATQAAEPVTPDEALEDEHHEGEHHEGEHDAGEHDHFHEPVAEAVEPEAPAAPPADPADALALERLRRSFADAPVGMALTGLDGAYLEVNRSFCRLLGRDEQEIVGQPFESLAHGDDQGAWRGELEAIGSGRSEIARWEQRFVSRDGAVLWTRASATVVRDPDGTPLGYLCQVEDLSDRRAAELELRRQQQDVLAVVALARDVTVEEEPSGPLCQGARRLLGADVVALAVHTGGGALQVAAEDGLGGPIGAQIPMDGDPSGATACFLTRERVVIGDARGDVTVTPELVGPLSSGTVVFEPVVRGTETVGVLAIAWRRPLGELGARRATTLRLLAAEMGSALERRRLLLQLRDVARTDALTGLANLRTWEDRVAVEVSHAARRGHKLCAAMIDIERFTNYVDRHGSQAGDRLLRETAVAWNGVLRTTDLLARVSGGEFALLLPDCDTEGAQPVVQRLRRVTHPECGCSVGLVQWEAGEDAAAFLARADQALYAAKAASRNGVAH